MRALNYYRTHFIDAEHNKESAKDAADHRRYSQSAARASSAPIVEQGMAALAANVQGEIIPECGHWVADEQPEYIIAALRKFFGS